MAKNLFVKKSAQWAKGYRYAAAELLMHGPGVRSALLRKASADLDEFDKGVIQALVHYDSTHTT